MRSALTFIAGWGLLSPLGTAAREQPPSGVDAGTIAPEELSAVDLTRVYDPTDQTAPRQTPTND
ncbi:MAG: hypothetical protein E6K33_05010 [Gammaproteobacteria bacterium]|nr:MAG: hypothetical protein E6K33_05010 [Gammaproteobacteria bacterium]